MASRANHRVLLGCALLCAAALPCSGISLVRANEAQSPSPVAASGFPIASDARLAGDAKQTRFVLDLDKTIPFRAFALADPYRVVVDIPQVNFQLPAGTGCRRTRADQGVPLRPGDAGRLPNRVRPDRPGQDRQFLCARRRQRPAAAAGAGICRGRPHRVRSIARRRKSARTAGPRSRMPPATTEALADTEAGKSETSPNPSLRSSRCRRIRAR